MSDPTPPETIEPEGPREHDDGRGSARQPSPASGTPPARVGGDSARERQEDITRDQPDQDPIVHAPESGGGVREEGKRGGAARNRQSGQSSRTR